MLRITPITATIGAEASGVDLRDPVDDAALSELYAALLRHQVIFLHDQALTDEEHEDFARRFGTLTVHPISRAVGSDRAMEFIEDNEESPPKAARWHTDISWLGVPPKIGILSARVIPEAGGDTMWASLTAAFQGLSKPMQDRLEGLVAMHDAGENFFCQVERGAGREVADKLRALVDQSAEHPLVPKHPDTGEKVLYISPSNVDHIVGLHPEESRMLLDFLRQHIDRPEFSVRWRWRVDDLAIWDERCTIHRGLTDHYPARRVMRRCTVDAEEALQA